MDQNFSLDQSQGSNTVNTVSDLNLDKNPYQDKYTQELNEGDNVSNIEVSSDNNLPQDNHLPLNIANTNFQNNNSSNAGNNQVSPANSESSTTNTFDANSTYNFRPDGEMEKPIESSHKKGAASAIFKIFILLFIPLAMTVGTGSYFVYAKNEDTYRKLNNIVLSVGMKNVNWQDLGNVFEPIIEIPIKTQSGYEKWEFLLDSGAVVSSLPREWADKMGKDIAFMKRSTFRGFGGTTSFAYQGEMTVLLGEKDKEIPVVFTEAVGTKSLLGRKGFFQDYSVYFNHKEQKIEIRE